MIQRTPVAALVPLTLLVVMLSPVHGGKTAEQMRREHAQRQREFEQRRAESLRKFERSRRESELRRAELRRKAELRRAERRRQAEQRRLEEAAKTPEQRKAERQAEYEEKLAARHREELQQNRADSYSKPKGLVYLAKRGQTFGFAIEFHGTADGNEHRWEGRVFYTAVYGRSETVAELVGGGELVAYRRDDATVPWKRVPRADILVPNRVQLSWRKAILKKIATYPFHEAHELPFQLSALVDMKELMFPDLPGPEEDLKQREEVKYKLSKGMFSSFSAKTIDATQTDRFVRVGKQQILKRTHLLADDPQLEMTLEQRSTFRDKAGWTVVHSNEARYTMVWNGATTRMTMLVRKLGGSELLEAADLAAKEYPREEWPPSLKRIQVSPRHCTKACVLTVNDVDPGQAIVVHKSLRVGNGRSRHYFLATALKSLGDEKLEVRLSGSDEEMVVHRTALCYPYLD